MAKLMTQLSQPRCFGKYSEPLFWAEAAVGFRSLPAAQAGPTAERRAQTRELLYYPAVHLPKSARPRQLWDRGYVPYRSHQPDRERSHWAMVGS